MKPVGEGSKGKKNRKQSVSALLPVAKTTAVIDFSRYTISGTALSAWGR